MSGAFSVGPPVNWLLTFDRPITDWDLPFEPGDWATILGVETKYASALQIVAGKIRIADPAFTGGDETVVYAGPPPGFRDSDAVELKGFLHALPS